MLPTKTSLAIAALGALLAMLEFGKLARPFSLAEVVDFRPRDLPAIEPLPAPVHIVRTPLAAHKRPIVEPNLIDPHENLKAFYLALWRTELGAPDAITRVLHYGDSPVTADSITADVRSLLQQRFGDAGHGFVLIAKPWAWYGHRGVDVDAKGWTIAAATQVRARDGFHGLGGVSFEGEPGAWSRLTLGEDHAQVEIHFLRQPGGGALAVEASGQKLGDVDTAGPDIQPDYRTFALSPGTHNIKLSVERGTVRLFGVAFERHTPGVIYNSLGLNGGQVQTVVRYFNLPQWTGELQHQRPDLVVINYGTNESAYAGYVESSYPGELRQVIARVQAAVPRASVLIMSPMDRGQREGSDRITTVPALPRLVEIQRQVAAETGCAFFNTFQAMGGEGTMARWYDSQPRLVSADFTHPLPAGARRVGVLLDQALESGYRQFKAREQRRAN